MHKERFFVGYDEFELNRPENRLIKSTLRYVEQKTTDSRNSRDSRRLLAAFSDIDESKNIEKDFACYSANRNMQEYDTLMKWCRIFLMNKSFTAFSGKSVAFALLFPMERLFESYVADCIKRSLGRREYKVIIKDEGHYLFDTPRKFALQPDIVVINTETNQKVVLDTKWKILSPGLTNYGISQADMYQMYAYHKKYNPTKVVLLYPYNKFFTDNTQVINYQAEETEKVHVCAMFYDLLNEGESVNRIVNLMGI